MRRVMHIPPAPRAEPVSASRTCFTGTMVFMSNGPSIPGTLDQWQQAVRYPEFRGHRIATWQFGSGPDLVLIHGFPTASFDWHRILPALTAQYRVTCLDMLGFGFSAKPWPHDYSLLEQADLHQALLPELGVGEHRILAHDYGDSVAQELLRRQDAEGGAGIRQICFLNGGLFPEAHRPRLIQRLLVTPLGPLIANLMSPRTLERNMRAIFGPETQPDEQTLSEFWTQITVHRGKRVFPGISQYRQERREHINRWLAAMQKSAVPMHFICGEADPISGAHMADRFESLLQSGVTRLAGIGHYPQLEAPEKVSELVLAWFAGNREK